MKVEFIPGYESRTRTIESETRKQPNGGLLMATLTGYKRDIYGLYIDKDPESTLQYTFDWQNWLATGEHIIQVHLQ